MVEIRKAKREESLLKKRREALPHSPLSAVSLDQNLISRIWSDKKDLLIEATTQIRTLLCGEMFNVHVEEVIQAGLVPRFVEFLTWDPSFRLASGKTTNNTPYLGRSGSGYMDSMYSMYGLT
ncbi:hypothetical protein Bca52824_016327 [Brassica carinata]|uniref:IBB domain-containing protein n=1 Tax=Brassica carinata TaxID=52824 RepID=A0A8X7W3G0_BRACI|nr:hypothetical protein Bca52824_016327 [Brassica carinata]